MASTNQNESPSGRYWFQGITGYQWLILAIASAGWIFDVYEGQIFNITRADLLADVLEVEKNDPQVAGYGDLFLAVFLLGGMIGGIGFGNLADRYGRRPIMMITILMYSLFSGLTYFADELWHVAVLRFLVAMGIGGEWAVAASWVAEVFPARARSYASGIFHASSVVGTWSAGLVGILIGSEWRYAYLIGLLPALLILVVRVVTKEPEKWKQKKENKSVKMGSMKELLTDSRWKYRAFYGMVMAAVGLGTFWAVVVAGQNISNNLLTELDSYRVTDDEAELRELYSEDDRIIQLLDERNKYTELQVQEQSRVWGELSQSREWSRDIVVASLNSQIDGERKAIQEAKIAASSKFAYGIVQTAGGGLGLLMFGPLAAWLGRRPTFAIYQLIAIILVPIVCFLPTSYWQLMVLLPIFGFFTLGIHAGFAIYFPELFPTHLRATGTSFCFNGGRLLAVPVLLGSGWLKSTYSLDLVVTALASLFVIGIAVVWLLPETKSKELEE